MYTFGERLRMARERAGLSQLDVYKAINLNNKSLSRYEKDMTSPNPDTIKKLILLYDVSSNFIMGLSDDMGRCRLPLDILLSTENICKVIDTLSPDSKKKAVEYIEMLKALDKTKSTKSHKM